MNVIEQFKFTEDILFELMVSSLEEKYNDYYKPTEAVHK